MKTINQIIKENSKTFDISEELIKSIILQESSLKVWVTRYEPNFFIKYIQNRKTSDLKGHFPRFISKDTEFNQRSTSFGLMQIMGQVAREMGYSKDSLIELVKPELNIYFGCKFFRRLLDIKNNDIRKALLNWNGGGNKYYPDEVLSRKASNNFLNYNWEITGYE